MNSESELQRSILEALAAIGVRAIRIQSGRVRVNGGWAHMAPAGTPDLLLELRRTSFLEVKAAGGRVAPHQITRQQQLRCAGARVAVVQSVQDALAWVGLWQAEDEADEQMRRDREALERSGLG